MNFTDEYMYKVLEITSEVASKVNPTDEELVDALDRLVDIIVDFAVGMGGERNRMFGEKFGMRNIFIYEV